MVNPGTQPTALPEAIYSSFKKNQLNGLAVLLLSVCFLCGNQSVVFSQELNCRVEINAQKSQTTDPRVFETLRSAIFEFMNNRKWTSDIFRQEEKIECSFFINITEDMGSNRFRAQVNIQASRPVYNSDYNTVLLNHADRDWVFEYNEFQPLDFNENDFLSNLTSMLAFYAFVILALDYDTYSLNGGSLFYQKAQTIVNTVPANLSSEVAPGWKPFENDRNRYWIVDNLTNPRFSPIRESLYLYHRLGLDVMYQDAKNGRHVLINALRKVSEVATEFPNSMGVRVFFNAKSEELINIFSGAPPNEKTSAVQLLYKADPTNSANYAKIMKQQ